MPHQRLAQAKATCLFQLPQLNAAIPARASQEAFVGRKGQSPHPTAMPYEAHDARRWVDRPDLPQPDRARIVASGEQVPIRTPGQRGDRAGMRHLLEEGAQLRVPEPDGRIKSATGKQATIRGKSQTGDRLRLPDRPERGSTLDVPQLDAAISASAGEQAFVRAESEGRGNIRMRLPDPVQGLACPAPQPHFPTPTSGGPVLPALADGDRPDGINGL